MKASLPFRYIISEKREKYYVIFDFKDDTGKRKRKWVGTGLSVKSTKKALNEKVDELIAQFYEDYCSGKVTKPKEKVSKNVQIEELLKTSLSIEDTKQEFTHFLIYWLETIQPTIAPMSYKGYCFNISKIKEYFDEKYPHLLLTELTALQLQQLRRIRFHDLRHSCASLLLANGISMKAIQEWLGHSTFNVTADFYSHLEYNSKIASAETIARIFETGASDSNAENSDTTKK